MVEKSQDIEMDKSVAVGNVENNLEKQFIDHFGHWAVLSPSLHILICWWSPKNEKRKLVSKVSEKVQSSIFFA